MMLLLYFRLFLLDHATDYHKRARPDGFQLSGLLR
jgi:hypothetical protein